MRNKIHINGKTINRPSYFPKISSLYDSKVILDVESSYERSLHCEGVVIDFNKIYNLSIGGFQEFMPNRFLRFRADRIPEEKVLLLDPRNDLLLGEKDKKIMVDFIKSFKKIGGILGNSLLQVSDSIIGLKREYDKIEYVIKRENRDRTLDEIRELGRLENQLDIAIRTFKEKMHSVLVSHETMKRIIEYQKRVKSDLIVPPYSPQGDFDDYENLDLTLKSYQLAEEIGENILFTICIKPPYYPKNEIIEETCNRKIPDMFDYIKERIDEIPKFVGVRFIRFNTKPFKLKYFLTIISKCEENDVNYLHLFDGGMKSKSKDYLGLYLTKHGVNSYSNEVATTGVISGGGEVKIEGQYSCIELMKLLSWDEFLEHVIDHEKITCDCEKCHLLKLIKNKDGENKIEGKENFFYDNRLRNGSRPTATRNRKHHFIYQLLKFQNMSRNNPKEYESLFKDYSNQIEMFLSEKKSTDDFLKYL